ncbi:MAG: 4Fe-4S dicluster domain-containing protein [Candidatus Hodarchaeota archaeon]
MTSPGIQKEMAPKRARMMEMVLALGGLKEESAIPLSKVSEAIAGLGTELEPLTADIIAFPDAYFQEFVAAAEKNKIISSVTDKVLLADAISALEKAVSLADTKSLQSYLEMLKNALSNLEGIADTSQVESSIDLASILHPLPDQIAEIEAVVDEHESKSKADAEAARGELKSLVESIAVVIPTIEEDPTAAIDELQKLGTKTRYGPFLRTAAQLKRGIREGRIDEDRALNLISKNAIVELRRGVIMFILGKMGSQTVVEMSNLMESASSEVQAAIVSMIQRGEVEMVGLEKGAPVFAHVIDTVPNTTLVLKRIIQQIRGISKSLEGDLKSSAESWVERLSALYERLQKLGIYDESPLSDSMNRIREIADEATEALLQSQSSDSSEDLKLLVSAGLEAFAKFRLKITLEKGPNLVSGTNVYGEKLDPAVYEQMMSSYLDSELERGTILVLIRKLGAMTAKDITERTGMPQDRAIQHLLRMKRDELLTMAGEDHGYILYDVPRTLSEEEIIIETTSSISLQLAEAKKEIEEILANLKAEDIGKLATALETISKARDKLAKIAVDGTIIGESILVGIEDKIRSAVAMAYRTRARLPSTRPKVTIDELMDVDVPLVLEEYQSMMGYAPLLGFGTIEWDQSKCLGCKSCEISCPEDAIALKPVIEVSKFFEFSPESMDKLPVNRSLFLKTVQSLATVKPTKDITLDKESPGFGSVEVDLWLCVACRTCVRRCPGPDTGALELELKWNLPEVVRQIAAQD